MTRCMGKIIATPEDEMMSLSSLFISGSMPMTIVLSSRAARIFPFPPGSRFHWEMTDGGQGERGREGAEMNTWEERRVLEKTEMTEN